MNTLAPILLYIVVTPYDNKKMFVSWLELVHAYLEIALESDNGGHALMGRNDSDFFMSVGLQMESLPPRHNNFPAMEIFIRMYTFLRAHKHPRAFSLVRKID